MLKIIIRSKNNNKKLNNTGCLLRKLIWSKRTPNKFGWSGPIRVLMGEFFVFWYYWCWRSLLRSNPCIWSYERNFTTHLDGEKYRDKKGKSFLTKSYFIFIGWEKEEPINFFSCIFLSISHKNSQCKWVILLEITTPFFFFSSWKYSTIQKGC